MAERKIAVGVVVKHRSYGIGMVKELSGSGWAMVDFGEGESSPLGPSVVANLELMPEDGLEALLRKKPEEVQSWVKEAPLKLTAAALIDTGSPAKGTALRGLLEHRVLGEEVKWDDWWKRVRLAVDESTCFETIKTKNNAITAISLVRGVGLGDIPAEPLPEKPRRSKPRPKKSSDISLVRGVRVDDVPVEPLPGKSNQGGEANRKPPESADWEKWFEDGAKGRSPSRYPTGAALEALSKLPDKTIEHALVWATNGAAEFLASHSKQSNHAMSWLKAVNQVSLRRSEIAEADRDTGLAARIGGALVKSARISGYDKDWVQCLCQAGELDKRPNDWRMAFHIGMWEVMRDSTNAGKPLIDSLGPQLVCRGQAALVADIALAAFRADHSPQRNVLVDNLLYALPERERPQVLHSLIVRAAAGEAPSQEVADYVASSRRVANVDAAAQSSLLIMAALLLSEGQGQVLHKAAVGLADALDSPKEDATTPLAGLLQESKSRNHKVAKSHAAELHRQRKEYEARLEAERREKERLTDLMKSYAARAAAGREESRLEARLGMLTAIGEILKIGRRSGRTAEDRLQDVLETLVLALKAGEAEPLGKVGDIIPYDPGLHHAKGTVPVGAAVSLTAPGVIVRNDTLGDRLIVKATVTRQSEAYG